LSELVSIIIPTFNRAYLLGETLDSILRLTHQEWECLVVDDGSSDYTKELMGFYQSKDNRFRYLKRPSNKPKGANACRNYGFEQSSGRFINFFDSDDLIHPDKLKVQLKKIVESTNDFDVSEVEFFSENKDKPLESWKGKFNSNDPFISYIKGEISWFTPAILWKRNFLEKQEFLLDEDLQASQEWEFHIRILCRDPKYTLTPTPLVSVRKHEDNISYNPDTFRRNWNYFLARLKIYNNRIRKSEEALIFLRWYLINHYKEMVRKRNPMAVKAFKIFILRQERMSFKAKLCALISIYSFRMFGKGDLLLNKVKLEK